MLAQENTYATQEAILDYDQFNRLPGAGLTEDSFSHSAIDQEGRQACIELIIGFLSNITHDLSRAQCGLDSWQPTQVGNAADTISHRCLTVGAKRAAELSRELKRSAEANHPRESRKTYKALRTELIFVWQDLQGRLRAIRLDMKAYSMQSKRFV